VVCPGSIDTSRANPEWYQGRVPSAGGIPLGDRDARGNRRHCLFLVTDDSGFITGQTIHANGGVAFFEVTRALCVLIPQRPNWPRAKVVFGAIISRYAPDLVELFGAIGYDFVMIDCEHGPMDLDEVEHMVRAAEVFGITPITRIPNHADSTILQFLDRGCRALLCPCQTQEAAEAVARAARYHPEAHRGMGSGRAHDYGLACRGRIRRAGLTPICWSSP